MTAGDSAIWTRALLQFPTFEGWALNYFLLQQNGSGFQTFGSTVSAGAFSINVPGSTTINWAPAKYRMQGQVTLSGEIHTVYDGIIQIKPGISANPGDTRTPARVILDNIELVMSGRATDDILKSTINGTTFERLPVEQLIMLKDRYKTIVQAEEAAANLQNSKGTGRRILVRVASPTGAPGSPYWPYGLGLGGVGPFQGNGS